MIINPFILANKRVIISWAIVAIACFVLWREVSPLFTRETVTITHEVKDTTEVAFLRQQLEIKDAELQADTLAMMQYENMVYDVQTSKDSAVAFYERAIRDLRDSSHPGTIIVPSATATRVFASKDENGFEYLDTVSVVYRFPPRNSFEVDLMLARRIVITTHTDTETITTVSKRFELFAGPEAANGALYLQADIRIGNWMLTGAYRILTFNGELDEPDDYMFGVQYKIF